MKGLRYISLTLTLMACSACPEVSEMDTSCLESVAGKLSNDSIKEIDLGREINCFQWDSLEIGGRGTYKNHPCMNFTLIDNGKYAKSGKVKGGDLESIMDWFDQDRHWQMIYFYHKGQLLNEALAISQSAISFTELTLNQGAMFLDKAESSFEISDRILGGVSGMELMEHRQIKEK